MPETKLQTRVTTDPWIPIEQNERTYSRLLLLKPIPWQQNARTTEYHNLKAGGVCWLILTLKYPGTVGCRGIHWIPSCAGHTLSFYPVVGQNVHTDFKNGL